MSIHRHDASHNNDSYLHSFKGNDQYIVHKQTGITADASTVMARSRGKPARRVKRQVYMNMDEIHLPG